MATKKKINAKKKTNIKKKPSTKKKKKRTLSKSKQLQLSIFRLTGVALVVVCVLALSILGGLINLRPTQSQLERRVLTTFPELSWETFWNGDYFKDISLWYSDTYPNRDELVSMNQKVTDLYGINSGSQVFTNQPASKEEISEEQGFDIRNTAPETRQAALQDKIMQGVLIKDKKAYQGFFFSQDSYDEYQSMMEQIADKLEGHAMVYSILVPTNAAIELSQEDEAQLGGSDQKQSIDYYYSGLDDRVIPIGTYDVLKEHKGEDIYFHSDHHWTPLGAYYVYTNFCKEKGWDPVDIDTLKSYTFEPFYGSFASSFGVDTLDPDTFTCWPPDDVTQIQIYTNEAEYGKPEPTEANTQDVVRTDDNGFDEFSQYMRLIGGDNGFSLIDNPNIEDGTSCVITKESYGNAFIPWLVNHYDKIYIVDVRYNNMDLSQFIIDQEIDDLIMINNIQLVGDATVIGSLENLLIPETLD